MKRFDVYAARPVTQNMKFVVTAADEDDAAAVGQRMLDDGEVTWPEPPDGFETEVDGWVEGAFEQNNDNVGNITHEGSLGQRVDAARPEEIQADHDRGAGPG